MTAAQCMLLGLIALLIRRAIYVYTTTRRFKSLAPIQYCLIEPISAWSVLLPKSRWNPGISLAWDQQDRYEKMKGEAILYVPLFLGSVATHCGSPEACRQLYTDIKSFIKPPRARALKFMGENLNTLNGEPWRRHRKITAPAFDSQIYADVWRVTTGLYNQMMISEPYRSCEQHYFEDFNTITTRFALLVIAACGFNMNVPWAGSLRREGFKDPLDEIIVKVCEVLLLRSVLPTWAFKLPIRALREADHAFSELERFLNAEITAKERELALEKDGEMGVSTTSKNLFSRVVLASQLDGPGGLTRDEIRGNLFIYLFAGHETTANTLVTALALLAIHQEEQQRLHDYIMAAVGDGEIVYEDYNALTPVLNCFYETLRLYPAATNSIRVPAEDDTVLTAAHLTAGGDTLILPKDVEIILDIIGTCRNPRNFPDPTAFKPRRWESPETASIDNFVAFAAGPRLCLGRKFSTVESVCFLSNMLRDWKIDAKLVNGETPLQWRERVLQPTIGITLKNERVPLLVTRRRPLAT